MPIRAYFGDELKDNKDYYKVVFDDDDDTQIDLYIEKKRLKKLIESDYTTDEE